jgi:hypothetical protein
MVDVHASSKLSLTNSCLRRTLNFDGMAKFSASIRLLGARGPIVEYISEKDE